MSLECRQYYESIGVYALGAIDGEEGVRLEAHIGVCLTCRLALEEAIAVASQLGFAAPLAPPPARLKQQLLERLASEAFVQAARPSPGWRVLRRPGAVPAAALPLQPRGSWRLLAGAVSVLLLILLAWTVQLSSEVDSLRQERAALGDPLRVGLMLPGQQGPVTRALQGTSQAPDADGMLYAQPGATRAMLVVMGLSPLPAHQVYQLWLQREGRFVPGLRFNVAPNGSAGLMVATDADLAAYQRFMISIEPASGSSSPQGPVVLDGSK